MGSVSSSKSDLVVVPVASKPSSLCVKVALSKEPLKLKLSRRYKLESIVMRPGLQRLPDVDSKHRSRACTNMPNSDIHQFAEATCWSSPTPEPKPTQAPACCIVLSSKFMGQRHLKPICATPRLTELQPSQSLQEAADIHTVVGGLQSLTPAQHPNPSRYYRDEVSGFVWSQHQSQWRVLRKAGCLRRLLFQDPSSSRFD